MTEQHVTGSDPESALDDGALQSRRDFLLGLGRWSKIAIGVAVFGGLATGPSEAQAGAWVNRRGGWINGGGGWVNGGGGSWANRRGGGGWINRR